jgi:hypothetical protein
MTYAWIIFFGVGEQRWIVSCYVAHNGLELPACLSFLSAEITSIRSYTWLSLDF